MVDVEPIKEHSNIKLYSLIKSITHNIDRKIEKNIDIIIPLILYKFFI